MEEIGRQMIAETYERDWKWMQEKGGIKEMNKDV